jgi:myo-inositol-1(or 4)-monophosphatase
MAPHIDLPRGESGQDALAVARACARCAGELLRQRFGGRHQVQAKGRRDFVTQADVDVEREVVAILRAEFPHHRVISEETAASPPQQDDAWSWVVDPLDGTHNFSRAIPHFCFSLALCRQGEPVLALTFDPLLGEEFVALRGGGAMLNGGSLRVSDAPSVARSLVGLDLGYDDELAGRLLRRVAAMWPHMLGIRLLGSAALGLAYAACGRLDLYVHCNLKPWDVAAGILLVEEAGGLVVDWDGRPATLATNRVVAGAPQAVHDFLEHAQGQGL